MSDPLTITPFTRPARGEVAVPGSKSLTHRALLLAARGDGPVTLANALFSEDTGIMAEALRRLGFEITADPAAKTMRVVGQRGRIPAKSAELFVGNAGTAARFLTALCAAAPTGVYRVDGSPAMRERPMQGLLETLRALGADVWSLERDGCLPIEIHANGLTGGDVVLDARESSQMLSALLMVAPLAAGATTIRLAEGGVRWPFVEMTIALLKQFGQTGVAPTPDRRGLVVPNNPAYRAPAREFRIESDATAASYFVALPIAVGGRVAIADYWHEAPIQGDVQFSALLCGHELLKAFPHAKPGFQDFARGAGADGFSADFTAFSDTFLTLAAIAPLLSGPTRISGIGHTRRQDTDRVAGAARELRKLGQEVAEEADALTITPRPITPGVEIETYGDHRFAMSFAILGCRDLHGDGRPWLRIRNPGCTAKTFPEFFRVLEETRLASLAHP